MSRQLEQQMEDRTSREQDAVLQAVYGGLSEAVHRAGGDLTGFSVKLSGGDCLITLKAVFENNPSIAFVGSEDLPGALRKAVRELHRDQLGWREDRYAKG